MAEKQTHSSKVGKYLRCIRVPITLGGGGKGVLFFFVVSPSGFLQNPQQARFITDTNNANVQNQDRRRLRAFFLSSKKFSRTFERRYGSAMLPWEYFSSSA